MGGYFCVDFLGNGVGLNVTCLLSCSGFFIEPNSFRLTCVLVIFRSSDKPALGIRPLLPFGDEKHFGRIDGPKPVHTAELVADPVLRIYDVFIAFFSTLILTLESRSGFSVIN